MKKAQSKIIVLAAVMIGIIAGSLSICQAAGTKKALAVWFGQMNASYNGQDVTAKVGPIVVNGITYLPLRNVAILFNKNVAFSPASKTVVMTDKEDTNANSTVIADLKNQLATKDAYIQMLTTKINSLQTSSSSSSSSSSTKTIDIDDLEDQLNDDHKSYKNADFEISLSGDEDKITITIKTDKADWEDITTSYQTKYLQSIVDDINDDFKDADIEGKVKEGSTVLTTFSVNSDEEVEIVSLDTLEDKLNDEFATYKNADFEITLSGTEEDITVTIKTNTADWNNISSSYQEKYLQNVADAIIEMFEDADITGKVKDGTTTIVEFDYSSDGDVQVDNSSLVSSLQTTLNTKLKSDTFGTLTGIDNDNLGITLAGDTNTLTFTVNISLSTYDSEWDTLSDAAIKAYMQEIYNYIKIQSSFDDALVVGYFYDTNAKSKIGKLSSSGSTFSRMN